MELVEVEQEQDSPLDGVSITPLFRSPHAPLEREAIYAHFPGYLESYIKEAVWRTTPVATIRVGDWKLMEFFEDDRLELYNLKEDLSERQNLASRMPHRTRQLHEKLITWRMSVKAAMPRMKAAQD